ncbi:MAG: hypothetical protein ABIB47_04100 [Candidatus Woesearchaeota archaeon]
MKIAKGKRGKVYKILNFAIKVKNKQSKAIGRIQNEAKWLKKLNKLNIGPRLYYGNNNLMITSFIKGENIRDFFKSCSGKEKSEVIKEVFNQCRVLDTLKVDKLEMHRPFKHIIILKKKPVMIDFERCKHSQNPKNVTQFAQFLINIGIQVNKTKLRSLLKGYKRDYSEDKYKEIVSLFLKKT